MCLGFCDVFIYIYICTNSETYLELNLILYLFAAEAPPHSRLLNMTGQAM